ncbi:diguanylate cyclase [Arcobacter sp. CECT 8983]|uniref:transporter substrate-binding domain-containing diguanylate cyclase n=1 Tax=Arcobacter sp. CECT 8983 TaxID=2044508 RepID=UPI0013E97FC3|nr:transporter substrate-binding domain-containing protein [Arcobacter sp. CECT 8983]
MRLSNNLKSNIDILANQIELYFQTNTSKREIYISNLFKIYYENYNKIAAFEIKNNYKTIYSSYRDEEVMTLLKNIELSLNFNKTNEFYEKEIKDIRGKKIATLIVYFKKTINFSKKELEYLQNKKVLKVQNDASLPPYNFNENGIPTGYAIEYLELIANELALELKFIPGKWNDFMNMLENKELDLMINVLKSKKREERFLFSNKPFVSSPLAMLTRIEHKDVHTFEEMEGETMALVKGYHSYDRVKKDYPKINIYPTSNTITMMKAVSQGKADGAYGLKSVLDYNINKHFLSNLKTMKNTNDDEFGFYFAYNKDNLILKSIIQKAEKLISKKDIEELDKKWFRKFKETKKKSRNYLFTKEEISYLNKKGSISMCIDPNFEPFEFITKEGNYSGIIANFIETMSKNSGIKFEILAKESWSSSLNAVKSHLCDILPFSIQTTKRTEYLNFTKKYFTFSNVIATRDSEIFINSLEDIKNKKIAIVKDYATIELIKRKYPDTKIVEVDNTLEGLKGVKKGDFFAFVGLFPAVAQTLQKNNINNVKITGKTSINIDAKIAIRDDEPILQSILNKAINSVKEEEKEQVLNKWLTIIKKEGLNTKLFIQIITIIVIISALIIFYVIYNSNKKLRKLSQTDKLTNVYNRFKLDALMEQELNRKKRYSQDLSIILIDIDFFKKINDIYGHLTGDKILQEFAKIVKDNLRKTDYFGRWGGEEFLIILPNTDEQNAYNLAEKLRKFIETSKFYNNINITASFGVTQCKDIHGNKCLNNVDKALYEAKEANRNCVKIYKK